MKALACTESKFIKTFFLTKRFLGKKNSLIYLRPKIVVGKECSTFGL